MSVTVNTDDGLFNAVMEGHTIELADREYALTLPDPSPGSGQAPTPYYINIVGKRRPYSIIHLTNTLHIAYFSYARDVTFIPQGEFAALNLDKAAYATFDRVNFNGNVPGQFHLNRKHWSENVCSGYGVETTDANDGDNSYKITFNECSFAYLRAALHFLPARIKATNQTRVYNCEFDSCEVALDGQDVGNLKMRDSHIQLARIALYVNGNNNKFENIDVERTEIGIHLDSGSYGNYFRTNKVSVLDRTGELDLSRLDRWQASRGDRHKNVFVFYPTRHIARDSQALSA